MSPSKILEVFPYLRCSNAAEAIAFYQAAFAAEVTFRLEEPSGRIAHSELKFGGTTIMVSDAYPEFGIRAPDGEQLLGASIHLHVEDVDAAAAHAVSCGATEVNPPADQFYGERTAKVRDPFGHEWFLGSQIENISHDEIKKRFRAWCES